MADGKLQVSVDVTNSGSKSLFVMRSIRRIEFDKNTGVLTLWFSDRGRGVKKSPVRKEYTFPNVVAIDPGKKMTIKAELSEKITRLIPLEDGKFDFEVIDLSKTKTVVFKMAVNNSPFYFNPKDPNIITQLNKWGVDIERTVKPTKKNVQSKKD